MSALVAGGYILFAYHVRDELSAFEVGIFTIFPLACIWFSDEMGGYIGSTNSVAITARSPGWLVCALGWMILLLPVFIVLYSVLHKPAH
jgi:hypothetical protein